MLILASCAPAPRAQIFAKVPTGIETCAPSDQEQYTYRPARLQFIAACIRVVGTIVETDGEQDGDIHINVRLDDAYRAVLNQGNDFEGGNLIVEPVCQIPPLQADAMRVCAADATPLGSLPAIGDHVWLEGRYILDLQHHSWAELHPLYRWGRVTP